LSSSGVAHLLTIPLLQTIFLCVWQAVHLNIPPPGEPAFKQILRRIGWSILAIIAPEVVAFNAWLQYHEAQRLVLFVNGYRGFKPFRGRPRGRMKRMSDCVHFLIGKLGMLCMSVMFVIDRLRMLLYHNQDLRSFETEQRRLKVDDVVSQLDKDSFPGPWTQHSMHPLGEASPSLTTT
jgi:hypothetical protein